MLTVAQHWQGFSSTWCTRHQTVIQCVSRCLLPMFFNDSILQGDSTILLSGNQFFQLGLYMQAQHSELTSFWSQIAVGTGLSLSGCPMFVFNLSQLPPRFWKGWRLLITVFEGNSREIVCTKASIMYSEVCEGRCVAWVISWKLGTSNIAMLGFATRKLINPL